MNIKTKFLGIAAVLSAITFSTASQAEVFNGLYAGASTGWLIRKTDFKFDNSVGFKNKHSFNNIPLGIHLGFIGSSPNSFLWGVEAGMGYAFLNKKTTLINAAGRFRGQAISGKVEYEQKAKFFAELATKLGWNFDQFAAYILLGVSGQQVEHKFTAKLTVGNLGGQASYNKKDFVIGAFPGVGAAMKITDNWSARAEYKYHFQKSVQAINKGLDIKLATHDIRVAIDYAF